MSCQGALLMLAALLDTTSVSPASAPAKIISWHGDGAQVYACDRQQDRYLWVLARPEATLADFAGRVRGHHGIGPSWTASDGSTVIGRLVTTMPAPRPGAIPWLGLQARAHSGHGALETASYIMRTDTRGGMPPAFGCDAAHIGTQVRSPYQATYSFLLTSAGDRAAALSPASR